MSGDPKYDAVVAEILYHCAYTLGSGAKMPIKREALVKLFNWIKTPFNGEISRAKSAGSTKDTDPGLPRWDNVKRFMLDCCVTIGRLAASYATDRGSSCIELEDLRKAYNVISNKYRGLPGSWCPDMPDEKSPSNP